MWAQKYTFFCYTLVYSVTSIMVILMLPLLTRKSCDWKFLDSQIFVTGIFDISIYPENTFLLITRGLLIIDLEGKAFWNWALKRVYKKSSVSNKLSIHFSLIIHFLICHPSCDVFIIKMKKVDHCSPYNSKSTHSASKCLCLSLHYSILHPKWRPKILFSYTATFSV